MHCKIKSYIHVVVNCIQEVSQACSQRNDTWMFGWRMSTTRFFIEHRSRRHVLIEIIGIWLLLTDPFNSCVLSKEFITPVLCFVSSSYISFMNKIRTWEQWFMQFKHLTSSCLFLQDLSKTRNLRKIALLD